LGQGEAEHSTITQLDVLKSQERFQVYPVAKDSRGSCICQDKDYVEAFRGKYGVVS
jgi:hypothetical protein